MNKGLTFTELVELLIAELSTVKRVVAKLTKFTESLLLENTAIRNIHADLIGVIQELSLVQSELPNLMNSLISMINEVSLLADSIHSPITEIKKECRANNEAMQQKLIETQQKMNEGFINIIRRLDNIDT